MPTAHDARMQHLLELAAQARLHAYCPYSHYAVGAAVSTHDDKTYTGCNVENVSFGLSICAERNAIAAAVAAGMQPGELTSIAIVAAPVDEAGSFVGSPIVVPCGACLQVIAEFASPGCTVHCASAGTSVVQSYSLCELLPHAFGPR